MTSNRNIPTTCACQHSETVNELEAEIKHLKTLLRDVGVSYTGPSADAKFQAQGAAEFTKFLKTELAAHDT